MFSYMTKNVSIWMRVVTFAAAVLAVLFSVLAMPSETDHPKLSAQSSAVSAIGTGVADDDPLMTAANTACHVGHACVFAIMPDNQIVLARLDGLPELPAVAGHRPSVAGHQPYYPPRSLSLV